MGIFEKIFRPDKNKESQNAISSAKALFYALRGYRPVFHDWQGEIYESELVRAAIDARARHAGKLKANIIGSSNPSLQAKMKLAPNEWQTWYQFLYRTSTILDIHNTAFIVPVYDVSLNVTGYYPIIPINCEVVEYKNEPWLRYKFSHGDTAAVEMRKCAILTRFQHKDDFFGESNDALDETMNLIDLQNKGIEDAVNNSATYRFIAQLGNFAKAEDLAKERERFSAENLSSDVESGGVLLFPNTYNNIQQVKSTPFTVDADQMKMIRENVYDYFGVNDKILRNEANGDELDAFFNGSIEPFAIQLSEAMTKAVFSYRERALGTAMEFTANRLQYMSVTAKVQMAQQMLDRGVMSINEARELFNYSIVDGGDLRTIRGEYKNANSNDLTGDLTEGLDDANEDK